MYQFSSFKIFHKVIVDYLRSQLIKLQATLMIEFMNNCFLPDQHLNFLPIFGCFEKNYKAYQLLVAYYSNLPH